MRRQHDKPHVEMVEYTSWRRAKDRCYLPSNPSYERYGARGITMCDRWRQSFDAFLSDLGRKPSPQHTLDRIDSNGHYEPDNCRWASKAQQCENRERRKPYKTHCPHGHELTPDNIYLGQRGGRNCRRCVIERATVWNATHKAQRRASRYLASSNSKSTVSLSGR